ncbi:MAG: bifunctional folylpolyglutamate synthase/dihydrofolate synthase [Ruminococcus sp.]|jgi:dihydrofolate synthase/folylpolyglutamate synthase|nr:bifunctional folylpolyglutamate synthase/dihydrofolate synthase [Ruminococcus sp.]
MNFYETMEYIGSFPKLGEPVTSLNRFAALLQKFDNPQDRLQFIHVAGTNGKGSTVRMIAESLRRAGYVAGEFSSPYIREWSERIRINGVNIPRNTLIRIVEYVKPVFDMESTVYSQFELTTVIAFIYFASQKCDVVVLETGIGGLLDCTNVVKTTLISVITSISFDHTAILGDSITAIAEQKAGIIKPGSITVCYPDNPPEAERIILKTALQKKSEFIKPDLDKLKNIESGIQGSSFRYKHRDYELKMAGVHQVLNAVTAIETLESLRRLGFERIRYSVNYDGLKNAYLHSRLQIIHDKPLIILDGAHNPDGMRSLAAFVRKLCDSPKIARTVMIVGMREDKDYDTALAEICRYIDTAICVDGFMPGTVSAARLAKSFRRSRVASVSEAVRLAMAIAGTDGMIVIGGSLYLAEALNKYMDTEFKLIDMELNTEFR